MMREVQLKHEQLAAKGNAGGAAAIAAGFVRELAQLCWDLVCDTWLRVQHHVDSFKFQRYTSHGANTSSHSQWHRVTLCCNRDISQAKPLHS